MPKQIRQSVGRNATNTSPSDVLTVQYLLNCVPVSHGGPAVELGMDGIIGPKTVKAIEGFQSRWFSYVDGRVDPNGQTFGALSTFDPAPQQSLPPAGGANVKNTGNSAPGSKTAGAGWKLGTATGGAGWKGMANGGAGWKLGTATGGAGWKLGTATGDPGFKS